MRRLILLTACLASACTQQLVAPVTDGCDNPELTAFDELLVVAPHPDDEILGFAGLADAYIRQGKPVRTVVVTDGDAYCEACSLWTTGSVDGKPCDALMLSNLETSAIDSLAETRRQESTAAAAALGRPAPEFLSYPDTGIGAARRNLQDGDAQKALRRSDFSACTSCGDCNGGYGEGPATELSASTLLASLDDLLESTSPDTLIATTHWLDGHADHAALGTFVSERAARTSGSRTVAFAVIHAHTTGEHAYADCWYPGPAAIECPCFDEAKAVRDAGWLESLRAYREQPQWPQVLPDDVDYGDASQLCIDEPTRQSKAQAIDAFETQLGTVGIAPGVLPETHEGLLDCSGYLRSFGRRTEVFVIRSFP